ncbi:MAG: hypothetical protein IPJ14_12220 [Kineosporiaceae bacterium]|nr:hypothetical protein [Kineosporiaceae bacterium]
MAVGGTGAAVGAPIATSATLELTQSSSLSITPGGSYVLSGVVRNTGGTPLRSLAVRMHLDWPRLTGPEIVQWAARSGSERLGVTWATQTLPGALAPDGSTTFALTGAADDLGLPLVDGFGPRGLAIELLADDGDGVRRLDLERTFVVWDPTRSGAAGQQSAATRVAVLAPLTPLLQDASSDAGTPSGSLVRQWQSDGRLSRILRATSDRSVGWAIDPSLITAALTAQGRIIPAATGTPQTGSTGSTGFDGFDHARRHRRLGEPLPRIIAGQCDGLGGDHPRPGGDRQRPGCHGTHLDRITAGGLTRPRHLRPALG